MNIFECKELAEKTKARALGIAISHSLKPYVVIVKINEDKASATYVKRKMESMRSCGIECELAEFHKDVTTEELKFVVRTIDKMTNVTGIIIQMPVPKHIDIFQVLEEISPEKDVDCLTSKNLGLLAKGKPNVLPATPRGIVRFLREVTSLTGLNILMIGRSEIVGLPLSIMLQQENATVTLAHSKSTYDVNAYDVVISAIGQGESVVVNNCDAICVDVGINFKEVDGKFKQIGDFDINNDDFRCKMVTAPKGGIGVLTSATVCLNAVELALKQKNNRKNEVV